MQLRVGTAVLATVLTMCFAASGEVDIVALRQTQVSGVVLVLKAEISSLKLSGSEQGGQHGKASPESNAFSLEAAEGRVEPLSWLKQHSKYVVVPPGVTYHAQCSREVSRSGLVQAVFTFGVVAGGLSGRLDQGMKPEAALASGARMMDAKGETLLKRTRDFYATRQVRYAGNVAVYTHGFLPPDKSLMITFMELNPYRKKACAGLPNGPILDIHLPTAPDAETEGRETPATEGGYERALKRAGLSESEYLNIIVNLEDAQKLDSDSAQLEATDEFLSSLGDSEETRNIRRNNAIRRKNLAVYRASKAELDSLLKERISLLNGRFN
jgi:hypothetical protein